VDAEVDGAEVDAEVDGAEVDAEVGGVEMDAEFKDQTRSKAGNAKMQMRGHNGGGSGGTWRV